MNNIRPKTTAVDIALLPPDEIFELSKKYNSLINNQNPGGLVLDDTHLPHITLVQQYIDTDKQTRLFSEITSAYAKFKPINLKISGIDSLRLSDGKEASYFIFEDVTKIQELHEALMEISAPCVSTGDESSFFTDPGEQIRASSLDWTTNFRDKASGPNFEAHITLGIGHKPKLEDKLEFCIYRLAVCQLGNYNTCRKILKEWRLTK